MSQNEFFDESLIYSTARHDHRMGISSEYGRNFLNYICYEFGASKNERKDLDYAWPEDGAPPT